MFALQKTARETKCFNLYRSTRSVAAHLDLGVGFHFSIQFSTVQIQKQLTERRQNDYIRFDLIRVAENVPRMWPKQNPTVSADMLSKT